MALKIFLSYYTVGLVYCSWEVYRLLPNYHDRDTPGMVALVGAKAVMLGAFIYPILAYNGYQNKKKKARKR